MKYLVILAVTTLMVIAAETPQLEAQMRSQSAWGVHIGNGFGYPGFRPEVGPGCGGYFPFAFNDFYNPYSFNRPEPQPYFAMNPPVYYSDQIVRRPVGISPYPVPPGVTPVEMTIQPQAKVMVNPYFKEKKAVPVTKKDTDT